MKAGDVSSQPALMEENTFLFRTSALQLCSFIQAWRHVRLYHHLSSQEFNDIEVDSETLSQWRPACGAREELLIKETQAVCCDVVKLLSIARRRHRSFWSVFLRMPVYTLWAWGRSSHCSASMSFSFNGREVWLLQ